MSMRPLRVLLACVALSVAAVAQINTTNFKYVSIDVPGSVATEARGINNNGEIVGWYQTGTNCPTPSTCVTHGFKLVNKVFTTIDLGNKTDTEVHGVNDLGDLAGFYTTADGRAHGFLLRHTGGLTTLDFPGASFGTAANGVNNSLEVVGKFDNTGFTWQNGHFTKVDITVPGQGEDEDLNAISNNGFIVGSLFRGDFFRAWQKFGSDLDIFFRVGGSDTRGQGVNSRDDIIGTGTLGAFISFKHEAVETTESSAEDDLHPHLFHFPGTASFNTSPWGINFAQSIVGSYLDANAHQHGFLAVH
jgi:uncharacterized membrane protein